MCSMSHQSFQWKRSFQASYFVARKCNAINAQKMQKKAQNATNVKDAENAEDVCHARTATNATIPRFNHERLFCHNGQGTKWGGGGAPPWGASIRSAAPPLVVRSVLDREIKFCQICFLKFLSKASCNMACSRCF